MASRSMTIAGRPVGTAHPCYVIAEIGVNHNGDMDLARRLIDAAVDAGVDAVKFQTFTAERLASRDTPQAAYAAQNLGDGTSHFEMLQSLELSDEDHRLLKDYCERKDVTFLSSGFDEASVDYLASLGVPAFKIPSGELTNLPYLIHVASLGLPLIVSTGMADLDEVKTAVSAIETERNNHYVLLHCVSDYPASPEDVNLLAMKSMEAAFECLVGYSDHTMGADVAIAAVALGACVVEKHVTLDRSLPGPDHRASIEPGELALMIRGIRTVESALGTGVKTPSGSERKTASVARKSLVAGQDLVAGTVLTKGMLSAKRPGTGLPPSKLGQVVGQTLKISIAKDTLLAMDMLE